MNGKEIFVSGCKLLGIYCIVLSVPALLSLIPSTVMIVSNYEQIGGLSGFTVLLGHLSGPIYLLIGVYLASRGGLVHRIAYPEGPGNMDLKEEKFLLYLKMLGVFLIVSYIPDFLKILSSLGILLASPEHLNIQGAKRMLYVNLASAIWGAAAGIYLLRSGRHVVRFAFRTGRMPPEAQP